MRTDMAAKVYVMLSKSIRGQGWQQEEEEMRDGKTSEVHKIHLYL